MGTHKSTSKIVNLKQNVARLFTSRRSRFTPLTEAQSHRRVLTEMYRSRFGLDLHPLQTDYSMVPPAEVIYTVQGKNKADPHTFLGTGWRNAAQILELLHSHGYEVAGMKRMLDFGVGTGRVLLQFLPFNLERYGCDVNPTAVEWTSSVLGNFADIRLTTLEPPLPYNEDFFDLVIALSVFTHTPLHIQTVWVTELARIVKPGGCVVATIHDFSRMEDRIDTAEGRELGLERGLHMNSYLTPKRLEQIWTPAFQLLEIRRDPPGQSFLIARRARQPEFEARDNANHRSVRTAPGMPPGRRQP